MDTVDRHSPLSSVRSLFPWSLLSLQPPIYLSARTCIHPSSRINNVAAIADDQTCPKIALLNEYSMDDLPPWNQVQARNDFLPGRATIWEYRWDQLIQREKVSSQLVSKYNILPRIQRATLLLYVFRI